MAIQSNVSSDLVNRHLGSLADLEGEFGDAVLSLNDNPYEAACYLNALTSVRRARRMLESARDSIEEAEQKQKEGDRAAPRSPSRPAA